MNLLGILLLLIAPALILGWLLLDSWGSRPQRVTCGILALLFTATTTWFVTHMADTFTFNIKYGKATKSLIDQTIRGLESGQEDVVLDELMTFQSEYHPAYKNSANYIQWAQKAADQIESKNPQQGGADEPDTAVESKPPDDLNPPSRRRAPSSGSAGL